MKFHCLWHWWLIAQHCAMLVVFFSIIGLYLSVILVIAQFVRMNTTGLVSGIMWSELPYVNRVWRICQDIYLCRESCEFELEEELVAKITFLYRSPETMIKITRPPKED